MEKTINLEDICKNEHVKRACEVALAGGHSITFVGPWESQAPDFTRWARERGLDARHATPCPCGYYGNGGKRECTCSLSMVAKWQRQHFTPRRQYDIQIEVTTPYPDEIVRCLNGGPKGEPESAGMERIGKATGFTDTHLNEGGSSLLKAAIAQMGLTVPQARRVLALARTIANLARSEKIETHHLAEAIQYRPRVNGW